MAGSSEWAKRWEIMCTWGRLWAQKEKQRTWLSLLTPIALFWILFSTVFCVAFVLNEYFANMSFDASITSDCESQVQNHVNVDDKAPILNESYRTRENYVKLNHMWFCHHSIRLQFKKITVIFNRIKDTEGERESVRKGLGNQSWTKPRVTITQQEWKAN